MNLIKKYSGISKSIILFTIIIIVSSCTALSHQRARVLNNIYIEKRDNAGWALQEANCEKAESEMLEAVEISTAIRDTLPNVKEAGSNLAEAYKLLGTIYSDDNCKKYPEALDAYNRSLELREYIYGTDSPLYAHALNDLAWGYYYKQKEYDTAEAMLLRSKEIYEANINNKPYLVIVYTNLGEVYRAQGRIQEAEAIEKKKDEIN